MAPPNKAITRATEADIAAMANCTPTQPTQGTYDPRRTGQSATGLGDTDAADILCILHPCSPAAFSIVESTARVAPQHVLQNVSDDRHDDGFSPTDVDNQETFIVNSRDRSQALDLALRFSSARVDPAMGFLFGRNRTRCDIVIGTDTVKRVSNIHFRIYVNQSGVCMLEDLSVNGTVVDNHVLKGKGSPTPATRMLNAGSVIEILSTQKDEVVKFIMRIPSRESLLDEFNKRFCAYMQEVATAEIRKQRQQLEAQGEPKAAYQRLAATGNLPMVRPVSQHNYGMKWNGGDRYNVVGNLGQGAFATVYRLATKHDGQLYAAKELEKRRFMKNNVLDRKLNNELQIMRSIDHRHIVRYIDYQDVDKHLYIIMEYVPCGDLQQWLVANGPLPEVLANVVAQQVLGALAYLHKKRITHRDIKPDNILISNDSIEGFSVKLSDFGLSKVVKDNDTFLKTFCGTLLYCAPEVFPQYDNYLAAQGKGGNKRKNRRTAVPQRPKYHMYSQSVDVWSLGGVLWYAMCLKPPFEGVADATGRGMFEKIMTAPLDPGPLRKYGVSDLAIDLLDHMLDTDPAERPTPEKCLLDPWFENSPTYTDSQPSDHGLDTIREEDEADEGAEPDLSQLSLHDGGVNGGHQRVKDSSQLSDHDYLDPRQSKRFKSISTKHGKESVTPQQRDSSASLFHSNAASTDSAVRTRLLFGEIEPALFPSSGMFSMHGSQFRPRFDAPSENSSMYATSTSRFQELFASAASRFDHELDSTPRQDDFNTGHERIIPPGSSSLQGVEPDMKELHMDSPVDYPQSPSADSNEPHTPRTPDNPPQASIGQVDGAVEEETPRPAVGSPKEAKYNRQINLPVTPSFFYDPNDPSTHNPEYASSISGYDFTSNSVMPAESFHSLAQTTLGSEISPSSSTVSDIAAPPQAVDSTFVRPAPRLGHLTSTAGSFMDINITLSSRVTSWGRASGNTFVYPDGKDTRIPKVGIILYFHANGIEKAEKSGEDWTKLPGLHCLVSTESRLGIKVNGTKLFAKDKEDKRLYGRVYTGDVITICSGPSSLEFECTFFHGEGKDTRPEAVGKFHINREGEKTASTKKP